MGVSRVDFAGETLIDLTSDTVSAASLLAGATAHNAAGEPVTGTLAVTRYHVSESEPTASDGQDGDLWLVV